MGKKGIVKVDFSNVSEGGGFRVPAGEYIVKVKNVEQKVGQDSGKPYLNWELEIISGDKSAKGKTLYYKTSLQPQALFNLRNVLIALGVDVPKKAMNIDLAKLKGKIMGVIVDDDEFRNDDGRKQKKSEIIELFPVKKGKGGKWEKLAMPGEDDYDEDDDDDDDDEDDDGDDDDEDDDEDDDDDDDDEDEDDEDDEEDEPAPKKKKKSPPPAKKEKVDKKKKPADKKKGKKK